MRKLNRLTMTLALLLMAVGGAWAQETPLLTIESKDNTSFTSGSKTFDDKVTVTFSKTVYNDGNDDGWYGTISTTSLLTVAGINGYTITSCKFYTKSGTASTGYTIEGESPSVYLSYWTVYTDANQSEGKGTAGITKIVVYGTAPAAELTEWSLTPDETGKKWTLAKMPASDIELQVEYEPTKVTMAANDKAMGTVEVASGSKVEWTADTWKGWTQNTKTYTVDDITITSSQTAYIEEYTHEDDYLHSLSFFVRKMVDDATVTFSTTGDPFSRIEFTMIDDYSDDWNPSIIPNDNWTFEGKSAVWEGEATKSLTLQSCTTFVSKITFFKGAAIPDGVTVNGDGTFTVAKTATVTLKATPAEGYKFLYWEDDHTNTNPVREVTIESGMADKTYKAVFAEITYNVTFVEGTDLNEWSATPNTNVKKETKVDIKYTGTKKVLGVKAEKKAATTSTQLSAATTDDIGKVVCAAGHLHDAKTAVPDGCTAVGILAKVTETGHGLILSLQDATEQTWNTINGWTSASYAGTTLKVLTDAARGTNLTSYTTLGSTSVSNWAVAQKSDYEAIFTNLGSTKSGTDGITYDDNVNAYITTGVGGAALSSYYWSATELDDPEFAWVFYNENWYHNGFRTDSYDVRPVLGF